MAKLYDYNKDHYGVLLASDKLDVSNGALFGSTGNLAVNEHTRTILIGIGGTGVRTIDYVKGAIQKRLAPNWEKYVAFLAIDSDRHEIDQCSYIKESDETVIITRNYVGKRMADPAKYPQATVKFMIPNAQLGSLDGNGCGRTRLAGKIKIHDQEPGNRGVDEDIVDALEKIRGSKFANLGNGDVYEVYIIGSGSGGTGSGGMLELPSMIRRAFPNRTHVHLMLYLPDTLSTLAQQWDRKLQANGYATLKELNYYIGMSTRSDYEEVWTYNDSAKPELVYKSQNGDENFVDIPYLVGTIDGASATAFADAQTTIAEFFVSLLGKFVVPAGGMFLTDSFLNNATASGSVSKRIYAPYSNETIEAQDEFHAYPKRYAAIGFARATFPKKLARAYTVGQLCDKTGITPVSSADRIALIANDAAIVPWRGRDDLMNAKEGTDTAKKILEPIKSIFGTVNSGNFNLNVALNGESIKFAHVKQGKDNQRALYETKATLAVKQATSVEEMNKLKESIFKAFSQYRNNVKEFVKKEGPHAFANLYSGKFTKVNNDFGTGIGEMLRKLVEGIIIGTDNPPRYLDVNTASNNLDAIQKTINNTGALALDHGTKVSNWVNTFNSLQNTKINTARREAALGKNGYLAKCFVEPAALLYDEVNAFAYLLDAMSGTYKNLGSKMENINDFTNAKDNFSEINIAAIDPHSYAWMKNQADSSLAAANLNQIRNNLVEAFFGYDDNGNANSTNWLNVPEGVVEKTLAGELRLTVPDRPISARRCFDEFISEHFADNLNVDIEGMFADLKDYGVSYDEIADNIIKKLEIQSRPCVNGNIPAECMFKYITYPDSLLKGTGDGPAIAAAITTAAGNKGIKTYPIQDTDGFCFYQQAAPFEIYRLAELKKWEEQYENGSDGINGANTYLHGLSPDTKIIVNSGKPTQVIENIPWTDYPPLTYVSDPKTPDSRGVISREGRICQKIDETVKKAKKMGVLFSQQTINGKWIINRVYCSKQINWTFNANTLLAGPNGLLPVGKDFLQAYFAQNGQNTQDFTAQVALANCGVYDLNHQHDTEDMAWKHAAKALRFHVPMYTEIRDTVALLEPHIDEIEAYNAKILKELDPAKFAWLVKGGLVRKNSNNPNAWEFETKTGQVNVLLNLDPTMLGFISGEMKAMVDYNFIAKILFDKVENLLEKTKESFDEARKRADDAVNLLMNTGDVQQLQINDRLFQNLIDEKNEFVKNGAVLDGLDHPTLMVGFKNAYPNLVENKLKELEKLYFAMEKWSAV